VQVTTGSGFATEASLVALAYSAHEGDSRRAGQELASCRCSRVGQEWTAGVGTPGLQHGTCMLHPLPHTLTFLVCDPMAICRPADQRLPMRAPRPRSILPALLRIMAGALTATPVSAQQPVDLTLGQSLAATLEVPNADS